MLRAINALLYALFAALGAALLAPPLTMSVRALFSRFSYEPDLRLPQLWLVLALVLFASLTDVARRIIARRPVGMARYALLLGIVALSAAARRGLPAPTRLSVDDGLSHIIARLESTANEHHERQGRYPLSASLLESELSPLVRELGYWRRGAFELQSRVHVETNASGPHLVPSSELRPGDAVFAVSADAQAYWVTVFRLDARGRLAPMTRQGAGVLVAHGRDGQASSRLDPLFPEYPRKLRAPSPFGPERGAGATPAGPQP